jgi:uncharacterized protein (DUF1810 family)
MSHVGRFITAQDAATAGYDVALAELRSGRKHGHWIWYIFPQLVGLGTSSMSHEYGLAGPEEAEDYLRHPILLPRLAEVTHVVANHLRHRPSQRLAVLMGAPVDAHKLVSSMTLFRAIARRLNAAELEPSESLAAFQDDASLILNAAAAQGMPECAFTLRALRG